MLLEATFSTSITAALASCRFQVPMMVRVSRCPGARSTPVRLAAGGISLGGTDDSISGFGTINIGSGGSLSGAGIVTASGGTLGALEISGPIAATATGLQIASGSTLRIDGKVASGANVTFNSSSSGTLDLRNPTSFGGTITGLGVGNSVTTPTTAIDFGALSQAAFQSASWNGSQISVTTNSTTFNLVSPSAPSLALIGETADTNGNAELFLTASFSTGTSSPTTVSISGAYSGASGTGTSDEIFIALVTASGLKILGETNAATFTTPIGHFSDTVVRVQSSYYVRHSDWRHRVSETVPELTLTSNITDLTVTVVMYLRPTGATGSTRRYWLDWRHRFDWCDG